MPTLAERLKTFLNSPRGKNIVEQGKRRLAEPENKRKARQMVEGLRRKRSPDR
ncbi:hypothetical protein [Actinoplanes sp. NPDC049316]|uniref:hypothetical protein n=1 Tax=Actinoplanes sp. NPDC049316 TaxID=3154727 RepID=UPI0034442AF7